MSVSQTRLMIHIARSSNLALELTLRQMPLKNLLLQKPDGKRLDFPEKSHLFQELNFRRLS